MEATPEPAPSVACNVTVWEVVHQALSAPAASVGAEASLVFGALVSMRTLHVAVFPTSSALSTAHTWKYHSPSACGGNDVPRNAAVPRNTLTLPSFMSVVTMS